MNGILTETWCDVGALSDVPRQGARVVRLGALAIGVFRTVDDRVFALEDRCPHKGGVLSQGIVHGHSVTCPLHNWVIGLESGVAEAPDEGCVRRFAARLANGRILIAAPASA